MDINQQSAAVQPPTPTPIQWTWIAQRQASDSKSTSIWKLGFIAPDGAEVRVTFHQVGDVAGQQAQKQQQQQAQSAQQMQMGMPPSPDPTAFAPAGQPQTDLTENATFYITFFSNRQPDFFMKWDTSLSHEDSLTVWITITHGVIDFVRKAKPANVILDDLANGKLKMIMRSVAMDVAAANPEYELEQTQKHHYRSFFQVKKTGTQSAFGQTVSGTPQEGDTQMPQPQQPGQTQDQVPTQQPNDGEAPRQMGVAGKMDGSATTDSNQSQQDDTPAFASTDQIPIKQTAPIKRGLTVEIGKDYSIAVKNSTGDAIDRYRAKNPMDILRWINEKGYGASRMVIVNTEEPSGNTKLSPERSEAPGANTGFPNNSTTQTENFVVVGKTVTFRSKIEAKQAAQMNAVINAPSVRLVDEGVEFDFETDRDMQFKQALVELAAQKIGIQTLVSEKEINVPSVAHGLAHLQRKGYKYSHSTGDGISVDKKHHTADTHYFKHKTTGKVAAIRGVGTNKPKVFINK